MELDCLACGAGCGTGEYGTGVSPVKRKYTWGLDLAAQNGDPNRDRQGAVLDAAGGIGGLLAAYDTAGTTTTTDDRTFLYFYDANGNVGQLVETTSGANYGALAAKYEYDPYGNAIVAAGNYAASNAYRFSTKPFDSLTGQGYWGKRWYDYRLGRWTTRDPIEEKGGVNLYGYVKNETPRFTDSFGLQCCCSGKNCKWRGQISMSFWGWLFAGFVNAAVEAVGVDDTGCVWSVSGRGSKSGLSGGVFGIGYFDLSGQFDNYAAPCRWPLYTGNSAQGAIIGVGAEVGDIPVNVDWAKFDAGSFHVWDFWGGGGSNLFFAGGGVSVKLTDVIHGPPCPEFRD
jgi:RHS repeat-associated protein